MSSSRNFRNISPQPVEKWNGILDASGAGSPRCPQVCPTPTHETPEQEDCLYLNVFTPKLDIDANLTVMVYIHGGGWRCDEAGGHSRAKYLMDQDIVLVTLAYRLSALGFLSTEDDVIPGNFGLKDQVMALRWVKDNIRQFGGNPNSVTIFGANTGGASVHYHLMSPLSKDLIKGGISESGVASSTFSWSSPGEARRNAKKAARLVGCPTDRHKKMLRCLRKVDAKKLVQTELRLNHCCRAIWQCYIDEFEDRLPIILMYRKKVRDEAEMAVMIKERYFNNSKPTIQNISDIFSDAVVLWPSSVASKNHKGPQWYYYFDHKGQNVLSDIFGIKEDLDCCLNYELRYLLDSSDTIPSLMTDEGERKISDKIIKLWVDFAKYGDPTPGQADVKWKQQGAHREYLHMATDGFKMEKNLLEERLNFWNGLPLNRNQLTFDSCCDDCSRCSTRRGLGSQPVVGEC